MTLTQLQSGSYSRSLEGAIHVGWIIQMVSFVGSPKTAVDAIFETVTCILVYVPGTMDY